MIIIIMVQANTYFSIEEDDKIKAFSNKWNLSKQETIKKLVRDFEEKN